jgi:hypothetical protein
MIQNFIEFLSLAYLPLLIGNLLAVLICLIAGSRQWSRTLCWLALCITTIFLCGTTVSLAGLKFQGGPSLVFDVMLMCALPVLVEFFALLAVNRWLISAPAPPTR